MHAEGTLLLNAAQWTLLAPFCVVSKLAHEQWSVPQLCRSFRIGHYQLSTPCRSRAGHSLVARWTIDREWHVGMMLLTHEYDID
jgi:hypothetical protein